MFISLLVHSHSRSARSRLVSPYPTPYFLFKSSTIMSGQPSRGWNAATHEALLLCIIDEVKPSKALFTKVTEKMQALGYTYSFVAILYIISP